MDKYKFQTIVNFTKSSNHIRLQKKNTNNSEKDNTNGGFLNFLNMTEIDVLNVIPANITQYGRRGKTIYVAKNVSKHTMKV